MREIVDRLREDAPDDPFWKGVRDVETDGTEVIVHFHEPLEPREVEAGEARVLCHLHDAQALAQARQLRESALSLRLAAPGGRQSSIIV